MEGDCLDILPTFPDCTFDLVVTSPPYPGSEMYSRKDERLEDQIKRIDRLSYQAMKMCALKLKPGGAMCWNVMHFMVLVLEISTYRLMGLMGCLYPISIKKY